MAATNTKSANSKTETAVHIPQLTANILILAAWAWLYWPLADYLQTIFTREDFRTNQILLIAVAALIISQVRNSHLRPLCWLPAQKYRFLCWRYLRKFRR